MENNEVEQNSQKGPKELALGFMKTLTDVARESFVILNHNLKVLSANPIFYETFQVHPKQTENQFIYELGNGQWNIPRLRALLSEILPNQKVVKNYEVEHVFEEIGQKTILLNAKQIDSVQLIILAMEDISFRKEYEEKLLEHAKELTTEVEKRTEELDSKIEELESINKIMVGRELKMVELKKEIQDLKKRAQNGNGKNGNGNYKNG